MSSAPSPTPQVDIRREEPWREAPKVSFDQIASLTIAKWVLGIFATVYALCFVMAFMMFWIEGVTYDKAAELVKFMLQAVLPLVTLAVGFYLGDRVRQQAADNTTNNE
jgi:hypothetical protein